MSLIRNIIFVLIGIVVLMSSKCAQTKMILQESPEFRIINAYTQKQVPGEQSQKPYVEFGFELKGMTNKITLDSVFCEVGQPVDIKTDGKSILNLKIDSKLIDALKYSTATFYYTKEESKYYYVLNDIKTKEAIFLP